MKIKQISIMSFGFFLFLSTAQADEEEQFTQQFNNCMNNAEGVTAAMIDCIGAEVTTQDARLNGAYQKLMASLSPARKKKLQATQRIWIQYRDANCDFYADPDGGTMAVVSANDCVLRATATRAQELQNFATQF